MLIAQANTFLLSATMQHADGYRWTYNAEEAKPIIRAIRANHLAVRVREPLATQMRQSRQEPRCKRRSTDVWHFSAFSQRLNQVVTHSIRLTRKLDTLKAA